ncbi:CHAT domain-containing protein [Synechocystis sp. LEGE 06083]|uniref:CHAT domain-containing protein n=1 Tax=Synechocystis sp. LEGE 06083 TaxID=915336 RepID=UPI001D13CB36|nr:CHAT domain-containing protein [Synechocystis sp. LEGE 06083]
MQQQLNQNVEEGISAQFTTHLNLNIDIELVSPVDVLQELNLNTGVNSALVYIYFYPPGTAGENLPEWQFSSNSGLTIPPLASYPKINHWQVASTEQLVIPPNNDPQPDDQLVIVLVTADGIAKPIPLNVSRREVVRQVEILNRNLTAPGRGDDYQAQASQLYDWFIRPIKPILEDRKIENISFILDRGLRSLPMATMYDRQLERYLVEDYSVGLMPSLALTNREYTPVQGSQVLAMGAETFASQNPLPAAAVEVDTITNQLWRGSAFLNDRFTVDNFVQSLATKEYSLVHLATHGEFLPGNRNNSFVVFSDRSLDLDEFANVGLDKPIDLMVLSACRTAVGDFDAELGFAGLAVKTGVKTAIGSLWYVSDEGTFALMTSFYDQLQPAPIKAKALQQAQLSLLKGEIRVVGDNLILGDGTNISLVDLPSDIRQRLATQDLTHPYFWSGFTLVGSPW